MRGQKELETDNYGAPGPLRSLDIWRPRFTVEAIFALPSCRDALNKLVAFSIFEGLFVGIVLPICIALGVPAWPTAASPSFGWVLTAPNWFVWALGLLTATLRNAPLTYTTMAFASAQVLVNLVVFILQMVDAVTALINLNSRVSLFAAIVSGMLVVLSFLVFVFVLALTSALVTFKDRPRVLPRVGALQSVQ